MELSFAEKILTGEFTADQFSMTISMKEWKLVGVVKNEDHSEAPRASKYVIIMRF